MLWQCGLEMDDDHILVQESIQDIMSVLTDFKQLDTEHLAWVEEYRSALEKFRPIAGLIYGVLCAHAQDGCDCRIKKYRYGQL